MIYSVLKNVSSLKKFCLFFSFFFMSGILLSPNYRGYVNNKNYKFLISALSLIYKLRQINVMEHLGWVLKKGIHYEISQQTDSIKVINYGYFQIL